MPLVGRLSRCVAVLALPALASGLLAIGALPARAEPLPLPAPLAGEAQSTALCQSVGSRPDRCLQSFVPGPVRNDEVVRIGLAGDGSVARVGLEQRLVLTGEGDYAIRERGPARESRRLGDLEPPVTKLGAVVWQGFSPGRRELAALLTLDAALEAVRLPLEVSASFAPADGSAERPLGPGGVVDRAGTVTVTVTSTTVQPAELPTAVDAPVGPVAAALDVLLDRARADRAALDAVELGPSSPASAETSGAASPARLSGGLGERLPAVGDGLPAVVDVSGLARVSTERSVPLALRVALTATGATASAASPGAEPLPGGAGITGTLPGGQQVSLALTVDGPATVRLDGIAAPALDPRGLQPPGGAASWADWAASGPGMTARQAALDVLVGAASATARAASYSPYLGADLPGTGSTVFRLAFAEPIAQPVVRAPLEPRPVAIATTGIAVLLLLGHGVVLWRRS